MNPIKVQKYKLIREAYPEDFSDSINQHLAEGWLLYGSPSISDEIFIQALVKPTEDQ